MVTRADRRRRVRRLNGAVTFRLDRAALTPAWVARDLKGVLRFQPAEIAFSESMAASPEGALPAS